MRQVVFAHKDEVDRERNRGHKFIEEVKVSPFQTGIKDAVKHENDDDLNKNGEKFGNNGTGVALENFFRLDFQIDRVVLVFFLDFFDLVTDDDFVLCRAVTGQIDGEKNDLNDNGKNDDGDTHIVLTGELTDPVIDTDEDVEEGLVDIGSKKFGH